LIIQIKILRLAEYVEDLCERAKELLVKNLVEAQSTADIEQRICVDESERNVKPILTKMITENGGKSGLPSFAKLIETYADPAVLTALQEERTTLTTIATEMSNLLLDAAAEAMAERTEDLDAFYQLQQAKSVRSPSAVAPARTIYGNKSSAAINASIAVEYPTAQKLHRSILTEALCGESVLLGDKIIFSIKKGDVYVRSSGQRTRRKHHAHKGGAATAPPTATHHRGHRHWLHDPNRQAQSWRHAHEMRGLPPHPGARDVMNWPGGGVSNTDDYHGNTMITLRESRAAANSKGEEDAEKDKAEKVVVGIQVPCPSSRILCDFCFNRRP
jgi:hypothetical protein